jgi:hypothetical protein
MSMNFKIIKIVTPSNDVFSVELSGDENELLDLLSMIVGIPQSDIKGLKDCYGNYYTISSAVNNPNINSEFSEFFYLICNSSHISQSLCLNNDDRRNSYSSHTSHHASPMQSNNLNSSYFTFSNGQSNLSLNNLGNKSANSLNRNYNQTSYHSYHKKNLSIPRSEPDFNYRSESRGGNYTNNFNNGTGVVRNFNNNINQMRPQSFSNSGNNYNSNCVPFSNLNSEVNSRTGSIFRGNNLNNLNNNYSGKIPFSSAHSAHQSSLYGNNLNSNLNSNFFSQGVPQSQNRGNYNTTVGYNNFNTETENDFSYQQSSNNNNNNYTNHPRSSIINFPQSQSQFSHTNPSNPNNFPSHKFSEKMNNSFTNNNQVTQTRPHTPLKDHNSIDKYLSIAQELYESNLLDSVSFSKLNQMVLKEGEEVINLMKMYCQDILDKRSLISGLNKILNSFFNSRPTSPIQVKNKLLSLIEQLESELFEDPTDAILLKNLIEYENEFIMGAFEVYESDKDLENFIESIRILINRSKRKPSSYNAAFGMMKTIKNSPPQKRHSNEIDENMTLTMDQKSENSISKIKTSPVKILQLSKETETQILSCLHTEERIIFKYAMRNRFPEIEVISQLFDTFQKTDLLIKPVKHLCKKFISEYVIKSLDESMKSKFTEILSNREKNKNLVSLFKEFNDHQNIQKLEKEVINFLKNPQSRGEGKELKGSEKSIKKVNRSVRTDKKRMSSSDTGSVIEDEESIMKEKRGGERERENFNTSLSSNNLEEFMNLIPVMKFLKPEEKKELEALIKTRNKYAIEVVENYYRSKNVIALKSAVLNLLKKKREVRNEIPSNERERQIKSLHTRDRESISKDSKEKERESFQLIQMGENRNERCESINTKVSPSHSHSQSQNFNGKIYKKLENQESRKNSPSKSYNNLESLLDDLEKSGKISSLQHKYIHQRYKNNDDMVNSAWEVYLKTKDIVELIESLKVFTTNMNKKMSTSNANSKSIPNPVTPADLKESKKEIIDFLKSKPNKKEKETVKIMQYNMIKILARDNSIEKSYLPLLKEMILEENPLLISAFEVFGVTKDHKDFSHTINIIAYLYNKNSNSSENRENTKSNILEEQKNSNSKKEIHIVNSNPYPPESKDFKLLNLFENFIKNNSGNVFNEYEKEILMKKCREKNQFLMSSIEFYEQSKDAEELIDTLRIILKN